MNHQIKDLPIEFHAVTPDPYRAGALLKLGNFIATGVIALGCLLIAYAFFPGLFH